MGITLGEGCLRGEFRMLMSPPLTPPQIALPLTPPLRLQEKKEAKRAAAAVTTRVSSATAKRMMKNKKQRKLLKTGDA